MFAFSSRLLALLSTMSSIFDVRFQLPFTCVAEHNVKRLDVGAQMQARRHRTYQQS